MTIIYRKNFARKGGVNLAPDKIGGGPKGELFRLKSLKIIC